MHLILVLGFSATFSLNIMHQSNFDRRRKLRYAGNDRPKCLRKLQMSKTNIEFDKTYSATYCGWCK